MNKIEYYDFLIQGRKAMRRTGVFLLFMLVIFFQANAQKIEDKKVTIKVENELVKNVLQSIKGQSGVVFMYSDVVLEKAKPVTVNMENKSIKAVLDEVLKGQPLVYEFEEKYVVIKPKVAKSKAPTEPQSGMIEVKGTVMDAATSELLPGVNIYAAGSLGGGISDIDGNYNIKVSQTTKKIVFSFIGYQKQEVDISEFEKEVHVKLEADVQGLDEVVVNGFFTQSKNSNTGTVTTIDSEELLSVSTTDVFQAITTLTPGMAIVEQSEVGSDPNYVPEIIIRGTNSLATEGEMGLNTPLIVLDGVEITLQQLYDIDIFDIERIDILKDASATALYGERAANGVIVVERKKVAEKKVRARYNFVPNMQFADLTSFDFTNSAQKLEFERLAGLYDSPDGRYDQTYLDKLSTVRRGVDTDWMAQPIRNSYSFRNALSVTGGGSNMDYGVNASYTNNLGVMKGDLRNSYGVNFFYSYHLSNKLTLSYRAAYSGNDSKATPYGSFSDYVEMNPYTSIYDENGEMPQYYDFYHNGETRDRLTNPLYNVENTSSFSKSASDNLINSLQGRWDVSKDIFVTGNLNLSNSKGQSDYYLSPDAVEYVETMDPTQKGSYTVSSSKSTNFRGQAVASHILRLSTDGTVLTSRLGGDFSSGKNSSYGFKGIGFAKDFLNDISFAANYPTSGGPSGQDTKTVTMGGFVNANFILKNKYFIDGTFRMTGSSQFGRNARFAPFWSFGGGYNMHNESWFNLRWVDILRLRVSGGIVGSTNFPSHLALTTYRYEGSAYYYTFIGSLPIAIGNPDLTWQSTFDFNLGLNTSLFQNRLDIQVNYYQQNTKDMLMAVGLPPSTGAKSIRANLGEMKNIGFDYSVSGAIIKKKDLFLRIGFNGGSNRNKVEKISDALRSQNEENNKTGEDEVKPNVLFEEGESATAIYAVRSAGIDPATGREIFIKKNGEYTFNYDPADKVAVGDSRAWMQGAATSSFRYKNFTLNISTTYTVGGDLYNGTLASKVEHVDPRKNVDVRAFSERWKQPGDHTAFKGIPEFSNTPQHSSRYVQRRNELYFSNVQFNYQFAPGKLEKLGLKKLRVGLGLNDVGRISTVKFERGTNYPYARSFNFIFSPTF